MGVSILAVLITAAGISLCLKAVCRLQPGILRSLLLISLFITFVLSMRLIFLNNDPVWLFYTKELKTGQDVTIGQKVCIETQVKSRQSLPESKAQYFALGSSQVNRVFGRSDIFYISFPNLRLREYPFYTREISLKHPYAVILYFSEIDLTKPIKFDSSFINNYKYLPVNTAYFISEMRRLVNLRETGRVGRLRKAGAFAFETLVPEVRYGFLARGLLSRYAAVPNSEADKEREARNKNTDLPDEKRLLGTIADGKKRLGGLTFDENGWRALEDFISALQKRGIRVIILEGQYNPVVMSSPLAVEANRIYRDRLLPIVYRHWNTCFIPRQKQFQFSAADYERNHLLHVPAVSAKPWQEHLRILLAELRGSDKACLKLNK